MHALVIEDCGLISLSIQDELSKLGYTSFDFASSAAAAIAAAQKNLPDLITADHRLSEGTGMEAVKIICADHPIPVIFIVANREDVAETFNGAPVLEKPFFNAHLEATVQRVQRLSSAEPAA
jgi:CheY-like chemotaxis protein